MYTLLPFLVLLSTCVLLWAQRDGWTWRLGAGYILLLSLGFYTHYFFPITLAIHTAVILREAVRGRNGYLSPIGQWVGLVGISVLTFVPWLLFVVNGLGGNRGVVQPLAPFLAGVADWTWFGLVSPFPFSGLILWLLVLVGFLFFRPKSPPHY